MDGTDQIKDRMKSCSSCYPVLAFSITGKLLEKYTFQTTKSNKLNSDPTHFSCRCVCQNTLRRNRLKKQWKATFPPIRKVSAGISCHLYIFALFCSAVLNKTCNRTPRALFTVSFLIARLLPVLS